MWSRFLKRLAGRARGGATKRSAKVTVLADASKFGVRSTHAVVDLNQAHHIIADQGAADRLRKLKAETGVDYSLAQGVDEPKVSNV